MVKKKHFFFIYKNHWFFLREIFFSIVVYHVVWLKKKRNDRIEIRWERHPNRDCACLVCWSVAAHVLPHRYPTHIHILDYPSPLFPLHTRFPHHRSSILVHGWLTLSLKEVSSSSPDLEFRLTSSLGRFREILSTSGEGKMCSLKPGEGIFDVEHFFYFITF